MISYQPLVLLLIAVHVKRNMANRNYTANAHILHHADGNCATIACIACPFIERLTPNSYRCVMEPYSHMWDGLRSGIAACAVRRSILTRLQRSS